MQVEIKIATSGRAFQPAPQLEVARILRSLADKIERAAMLKDCNNITLRDREGQSIGLFTVHDTKPDYKTMCDLLRRHRAKHSNVAPLVDPLPPGHVVIDGHFDLQALMDEIAG